MKRIMKGVAMNIKFEHGWMHLDKDRSLRLIEARGTRVMVRSGSLWITQDRDRRDYVLEAGETFRLDRAGDAIVFALASSDIELIEPPPEASVAATAVRMLAGAADAAGKWIARRFRPQSISNRNLRYWGNAI
jgi:hypothetical protein